MVEGMTIGEAAAELGVATHVLRHWEDVGVLVADRAPGGHRRYDAELLTRGALIRRCQRAGMSLAEILELFGTRPRRAQARLIARKREQLQRDVDDLSTTIDFLAHVLSCRHPIVSECPDCSGFGRPPASGRTRRGSRPAGTAEGRTRRPRPTG